MAEHTLSILVKALGTAQASKNLKGVEQSISHIGATAGQGVRTAASNIAKIGLIAAGGLSLAVKTGLDDLATLESNVSAVNGAIKQMGLTGKVTGSQVATWANDIEASIGAAFDDKDIVHATATLIRFGKVTPGNIRPAMQIIADLATKTGDVDSAATLLAKALADPEKAAGKLARTGVILTKSQQEQIKAFVKAGKTAKAQQVILDSLAQSTKGAAAASQGPYQRAISTLRDVSEDARKALAEGFLPVIEKVADKLSKGLANPKTMADIRDFGKGLASGFDSLLSIAEKLPWGTIGDSLKLGGQGAKAILDAFVSLPPWIQTAVITGWGLNKLTGGALGSIIGDVGKGLIKGVLGMNAGVVNIKAGVVNGAGGVGGAAGAAGGATGKLGKVASALSKVFLVGAAVGAFAELAGIFSDQEAANRQQGKELVGQAATFGNSSGAGDIQKSLNGISTYTHDLWTGLTPEAIAYQLNIGGVKDSIDATKAELNKSLVAAVTAESATTSAVEKVRAAVGFAGDQSTTSAEKTRSAVTGAGITTKVAIDRSTAAAEAIKGAVGLTTNAAAHAGVVAKSGGLAAAAAVRAKKSNFITNVKVIATTSISIRDTVKAHASASAYQRTLNPS